MAKLDTTNTKEESTRSALSAIAAGILVIIAGFLVYNYFSKSGEEDLEDLQKIEEQSEESSAGELETADGGNELVKEGETTIEGDSTDGSSVLSSWTANDIAASSISGGNYTVKSGDTLWEIAEGRYGSGFEWGKIKDANSDSVGFLPNGSQALIVPGQVLSLP
ncbi:MAG: LysM peptidoglycan-binding domain-containing protein [bacterium]